MYTRIPLDLLWSNCHPMTMETQGHRARTRHLQCPCGVLLEADDDDALVEAAQAHLAEAHPNLEYSRDEILFLAY